MTMQVQDASELVVVPTGWLHSTCNVGLGVTLGFGGEDDCDKGHCDQGDAKGCPPGRQDTDAPPCVCPDEERRVSCHGRVGVQNALATSTGRALQVSGYVEAPLQGRLFEEASATVHSADVDALLEKHPERLNDLRRRRDEHWRKEL